MRLSCGLHRIKIGWVRGVRLHAAKVSCRCATADMEVVVGKEECVVAVDACRMRMGLGMHVKDGIHDTAQIAGVIQREPKAVAFGIGPPLHWRHSPPKASPERNYCNTIRLTIGRPRRIRSPRKHRRIPHSFRLYSATHQREALVITEADRSLTTRKS